MCGDNDGAVDEIFDTDNIDDSQMPVNSVSGRCHGSWS